MLGNITNLILLFRLGLGSKSSVLVLGTSLRRRTSLRKYALTKMSHHHQTK